MVENVKNFETSTSREKLVDALRSLKYSVFEFLLSPWQFGMPNHRLRYYLLARRFPDLDFIPQAVPLQTQWPLEKTGSILENTLQLKPTSDSLCSLSAQDGKCIPLSDILNPLADKDSKYQVPSKYLLRSHNFRYDIVTSQHRLSSCFTKAYGSHHLKGSGSLVHPEAPVASPVYDFSDPSSLTGLGLRFFTPWEVAVLHGVPVARKDHSCSANLDLDPSATTVNFSTLTEIQRYRLLGNSLSVTVVAGVLKLWL
ncbi:hypothetical protein DSO57_1015056 [Entomophthora muscae]|uniref:Uncharacterized protein n=1 Tax=Entomophthora muscae TaxID=34485 RepID=A0ACC2TSV4_9FUNG|nr:hypothetical protein DSO57_1015056 [Entomophthora muscae]